MNEPTRYAVEWQANEGARFESRDVATLPAAKRLARRVLGQVWERPNIRPRITDDGITLYDWDYEVVVYEP